jgi:cysteine synthase B
MLTKGSEGGYIMLNQFANEDWKAHYKTQVQRYGMIHGTVTHFVAAMGTTGTIMGVYLPERKNSDVQIVGANRVMVLKFRYSKMAAGIFA